MSKITMFLILNFIGLSEALRSKRETVKSNIPGLINFSPTCSRTQVDVHLQDLSTYTEFGNTNLITKTSSHTGLLEVHHPHFPTPLFLCFPRDTEDLRQIYLFSHIACRQLGFMTFMNVSHKELPISSGKSYFGLVPRSYSCSGQEQTVTSCRWNHISIENCPMVAEISCGTCHETIRESSGFIKSPGFPFVYIFGVTCQWDLIVPEQHDILLIFNKFDAIAAGLASQICELHDAHVEITYGNQGYERVHHYCNFRDTKNLTIPFNEAKIRIFSGFYPNDMFYEQKHQGFVFSFEAIPVQNSKNIPWKIIILSMLFCTTFIAFVLCHCFKKFKICDYKHQRTISGPNAPDMEELNRAYEFQRCHMQRSDKMKQNVSLQSFHNIGSGIKPFPFPTNLTEGNYGVTKDYLRQVIPRETPRNIIPAIVVNNFDTYEEERQNAIERTKAKLLDRYSNRWSDSSSNTKLSANSSVFYSLTPSLHTCNSSSEMSEEKRESLPKSTSL